MAFYFHIDERSSGRCDVYSGKWRCDAESQCIPFTEKCDGQCFTKLRECADKCIPNIPEGLKQVSFWECTINGQAKCLSQSEKCNGECQTPEFVPCGQKCIPAEQLGVDYQDCNGYCIPKSNECIGIDSTFEQFCL